MLVAARMLFAERGWNGTKIDDVARAAGVSTATAYNHFKSKYALIGQVYAPLVRRLKAAAQKDIEDKADPLIAIERHFYELADLTKRRRGLTNALVAAMQEQSRRPNEITETVDDLSGLASLPSVLAALIEYGQDRGRLRAEVSAVDSASYYTFALLDRSLYFPDEQAENTASILLGQLMSMAVEGPALAETGAEPASADVPSADDLSLVLLRLMAAGVQSERRELANDELTRRYLEIGIELAGRIWRPADPERGDDGGVDGLGPIPEWFSEKELIDAACERGHAEANMQTFHERWPRKSDYMVDLLAYSLRERSWQPRARDDSAALASALTDPVRAAAEVGRKELDTLLNDPAMSVALIAVAYNVRHPELREAMRKITGSVHRKWLPVYEELFSVNDLSLRRDASIEDVVEIFAMLADGAAFRIRSGSGSYKRQHKLLSWAALAIVMAFVDPGDDLTLDDAARSLISIPEDAIQPDPSRTTGDEVR